MPRSKEKIETQKKLCIERQFMMSRIMAALAKVGTGMPVSTACLEEGIDVQKFRRFLNSEWEMSTRPNDHPCSPTSIFYWEEDFLQDLLGIQNVYVLEDFHKTYEWALRFLTEREVQAIRLRYEEELSFEEIGKRFQLSKERARTIICTAMRKLRRKKIYNKFCFGFENEDYERELNRKISEAQAEIEVKEEILAKLKCQLGELNAEIAEDTGKIQGITFERNRLLNKSIMELGLSSRSLNQLTRRAGIKTVGDILKLNSKELLNIRQLGKKSISEIIAKMHELGFTDYPNENTN